MNIRHLYTRVYFALIPDLIHIGLEGFCRTVTMTTVFCPLLTRLAERTCANLRIVDIIIRRIFDLIARKCVCVNGRAREEDV